MNKMECGKTPSGGRRVKKKQVKDELDRIKQAEKKKRRLEKALATSAAIRSELEKKKQKKQEEQQRLDEEGAAIAEAVALHVLLGEESDNSCNIMLKENEGLNTWDCASNFDLYMGRRKAVDFSEYSIGGSEYKWNDCFSSWHCGGNIDTPYLDEEISADLIAAQAVSSLQIGEDAHVDELVFNRMLRG